HGATAFAFFSHKIMRWLAPFFLLGFAVCVLLGLGHPLFNTIAVLMGLTGTGALLMAGSKGDGTLQRLFRLLAMFLSMNAALFLGFVRWVSTPQTGVWNRTNR
ncbi:MAG: hypothetical protein ACI87W_002786, partial [Halieaceae bacterium]